MSAGRSGEEPGRWVRVDPQRLAGWLAGFAQRHGTGPTQVSAERVVVHGADGARAECLVPFPPLAVHAAVDPAADPAVDPAASLVEHACRDRRVGVLLVRLGGHAAGVFEGTALVAGAVGRRPVHGRSAAGGWSQQRFARRREGQVRVAHRAAADLAVRVLVPPALDALVLGGDRRAVTAVLADPRLAVLRPLVVAPLLDVPDPRRRVLEDAGRALRAVRVRVVEPGV